MNRFLTPVLCLASAAMLAGAAPALAQTSDAVPSVTVKYGDLNIAAPSDAKTLLGRIEAAADTACGGAPDIRELDRWAAYEACRKAAVERAVTAVASPMLTAMAHGGAPSSLAAR